LEPEPADAAVLDHVTGDDPLHRADALGAEPPLPPCAGCSFCDAKVHRDVVARTWERHRPRDERTERVLGTAHVRCAVRHERRLVRPSQVRVQRFERLAQKFAIDRDASMLHDE
jgi:hypothetical protein